MPFVLGDLAYRFGWYKGGQTNHGELISPPVAVADLSLTDASQKKVEAGFTQRTWWLVYVLPEVCDQACKNRLYQMRQVDAALGKEAGRVQQLIVQTAPLSAETEQLIAREFAQFTRVHGQVDRIDQALKRVDATAVKSGSLYIMDPMGWIMMRYQAENDEAKSVVEAEDILNDMKKLLKSSRIG